MANERDIDLDTEVASNEKKEDSPDAQFFATAMKRFKLAAEAEQKNRKESLQDLKFLTGEQWPDDIRHDRNKYHRPCLTINKLPQFTHLIINDMRQNRPAIMVSPTGDGADIDTAEVIQGYIRHVEYESRADIAYDRAGGAAVNGGFGWFRLTTEYENATSFKQEMRIKSIRNAHSVYADPTAQEPDFKDGQWLFICEDILEEDFKAEFPGVEPYSLANFYATGDNKPEWAKAGSVRIAEYYYIEMEEDTIYLMSDKSVLRKSILMKQNDGKVIMPEHLTIMDERETRVPHVKWAKITGNKKLDETDIPGTFIPVIPVYGDEYDVDGEIVRESAIRHAKDPQRMYNYWASAETEMIALAPKAPWVMAAGQAENFEQKWQNANNESYPYLEYNPVAIGDKLAPPPQRNSYEPPVQAITNARGQSDQDLKATMAIYEPGMGQPGNETSGRAILARQNQSHVSNFHFTDNLSRAIRHLGKIILDWIPTYVDEPQMVRIISETGDHSMVKVNEEYEKNGLKVLHDLTVPEYDVVISSGPSYQTKRQEAAASMQEVIKAFPDIMKIAGDILVKNFDWPGAQELSKRLYKALPASLQDDPNSKIPPEVKAQMDQQSQVIQQLTAELNKVTQKTENKTMEIQTKYKTEMAKIQADLVKTMATLQSKEAMEMHGHEINHINELLGHQVDLLKQQIDGAQQADAAEVKANSTDQGM
jgi:hypothetical protein